MSQQQGWGPQGGYGPGAGSGQAGGYGQQPPSAYGPATGQPVSQAYGQPQGHGPGAGGQPAYGQPAYGQPAYGQPAYGQTVQPYGPGASGVPQPRSPILGMIALGVVVVCMLLLWWAMFRLGSTMGELIATGAVDSDDQAELQRIMIEQMGSGSVALLNVAPTIGMAGWIAGIVAIATRRGRGYGIFAVVVGALALPLSLIPLFMGMQPFI